MISKFKLWMFCLNAVLLSSGAVASDSQKTLRQAHLEAAFEESPLTMEKQFKLHIIEGKAIGSWLDASSGAIYSVLDGFYYKTWINGNLLHIQKLKEAQQQIDGALGTHGSKNIEIAKSATSDDPEQIETIIISGGNTQYVEPGQNSDGTNSGEPPPNSGDLKLIRCIKQCRDTQTKGAAACNRVGNLIFKSLCLTAVTIEYGRCTAACVE